MNIGDKVAFKLYSYEMTACWDNPYGITYLYTFKDILQRVFIWKTSKLIDYNITHISGRIKGYLTYNGVNEIELTYCRVYI